MKLGVTDVNSKIKDRPLGCKSGVGVVKVNSQGFTLNEDTPVTLITGGAKEDQVPRCVPCLPEDGKHGHTTAEVWIPIGVNSNE